MFLSTDEPELIIKLITCYPEFCPLYEKNYDICRNVEKVMGIFSKELLELDRNTAQYMMDEMQELGETRQELSKALQIIKELEKQLNQRIIASFLQRKNAGGVIPFRHFLIIAKVNFI